MAYTIMISEKQRGYLAAAMKFGLDTPEFANTLSVQPDTGEYGSTEKEEYTMLHDMIEQLPEIEAESPGCLHGLCL